MCGLGGFLPLKSEGQELQVEEDMGELRETVLIKLRSCGEELLVKEAEEEPGKLRAKWQGGSQKHRFLQQCDTMAIELNKFQRTLNVRQRYLEGVLKSHLKLREGAAKCKPVDTEFLRSLAVYHHEDTKHERP